MSRTGDMRALMWLLFAVLYWLCLYDSPTLAQGASARPPSENYREPGVDNVEYTHKDADAMNAWLADIGRSSRWAIDRLSNCEVPRKAYSLEIELENSLVKWRDDLGNTDIETLDFSNETTFLTTTKLSRHVDGRNEPLGQKWTYEKYGTDGIKVTPKGRPFFMLKRCP